MFDKAIDDLRRGLSLRHVWMHQAYHEVSARYKRTVLGSIWISGGMAATSLALAIVIGGIQGQNLTETLPYVMAGIIGFSLTGYVLSEAPELYMAAAGIIKNHAYPYTYYSLEGIAKTFIVFLHNIVVFYIATAILMRLALPHWSIVFALILVCINSAVWGSMAAMLSARFRDMRFMLPFVSQIIFFMTPVFWRPGNMTGWRVALVDYNPFYGLTEIVRSPLLGIAPPAGAWELSVGSLVVGCCLWLIAFAAYRGKIAFWV